MPIRSQYRTGVVLLYTFASKDEGPGSVLGTGKLQGYRKTSGLCFGLESESDISTTGGPMAGQAAVVSGK
jgi:hypothetical protein